MKLIFLLSIVAWSSGAKLDKTYLPPSHARSSSSSNFLQAPDSSLSRGNGFGPANKDFSRNSARQNGNGFSQNGNGLSQNGNGFNQNENGFNQNGNGFNRFDGGFNGNGFAAERPQASFERNAAILRQDAQNDGETYSYAYETENGIFAEESGVATNGVEAQGSYSYTGDDGQVYTVRYTADQNGFVPIGDHLPTAPPVPEEILKALEQNAREEAAGIYDDGSYSKGKYSTDNNQYSGNNYNGNNYNNGNSNRDYDGNDEDSVVTNSAIFRSSNQPSNGSRRFNGATKAYLPPVQTQKSQGNGPRSQEFGPRRSRPNFNTRDGYNY